MENVLIDKYAMQDIGNAIRTKRNNTTKLKPAEMASAILAIETGAKAPVLKVPENIENQVVSVELPVPTGVEVVDGEKLYNLVSKTAKVKVTPNLGYDAGTIIVNGKDTREKETTVNINRDVTITVSEATKSKELEAGIVFEMTATIEKGKESFKDKTCMNKNIRTMVDGVFIKTIVFERDKVTFVLDGDRDKFSEFASLLIGSEALFIKEGNIIQRAHLLNSINVYNLDYVIISDPRFVMGSLHYIQKNYRKTLTFKCVRPK